VKKQIGITSDFTSRQGFGVLSPPNGTLPCGGWLIEYLGLLLRMRILVVVPPLVALPMVVPPSSFLLVQHFEANLWWQSYAHRCYWFRTFTCRIWGIAYPHTLLEVCSAHKDKVEIKCMGSIGGKISIEPEIYSFFSSLRHFESW
jgi:hypothetical protein